MPCGYLLGLILLLLSCHIAWTKMVARCPEGWVARGGTDQCYRVHNYGRLRSFSNARTYCKQRGGDLAFIEDTGLRDWLGQVVASTGDIGQNAYMWVGAHKANGVWLWKENNDTVDNNILPWEGEEGGACGALTLNSKLIRLPCDDELKLICHRNITVPNECDIEAGWEQQNSKCYKGSQQRNSWHDASVECAQDGGKLASIASDQENKLAHDWGIKVEDQIWIAYTEEDHAGQFQWSNGATSNYTNWGADQPDLSQNGFGAAVVDNNDPDGKWMVHKITDDYHFLCKKKKGACLPGWETFGDSCYYFNTEVEDKVVWDDAKQTCEAVGAQLVVLDTPEEDKFFRNHMPESDTVWIGLYSQPGDGLYWVDGSGMDSKNYTHVTQQNIDDAIEAATRQCVFFQVLESESSWVPTDCTLPRYYACEVKAGNPITLIPPTNERYCREGWQQEGDHCYLFPADEKTWPSADRYCTSRQAQLVSIHTWAEQDFVMNHQMSGGWIGLNSRTLTSGWEWSDRTGVTITNWAEGEPNTDTETCVEMKMDNGQWNDVSCDMALVFTCKYDASTEPEGTFSTTTSIPDYSSACGYDWTENPQTGECYRLVLREFTFDDARLHCHEQYYNEEQTRPELVSIYSAQEQTFLHDLISSQDLSQTSLWMGMLNDYYVNKWLDDTAVAYMNWADGEPNGYGSEGCVEMYTGNGLWNDVYCTERRAFICEKKGSNYVEPQPPTPPDATCPDGWSFFDNHCYFISSEETDYEGAKAGCKDNLESTLASITNVDENNYVNELLYDRWANAWIGLRDDSDGENNWYWLDGEPFEWTNWGPDQPDNLDSEHCAEMRSNDYNFNGMWNDQKCNGENGLVYYVCKLAIKTCPQSWTYEAGKCYYASDYEATWNEARDNCKNVNREADLLSIHSIEENGIFKNQLTHASQSTWLGLHYNTSNSSWAWSDGQSFDYFNWNDGEPNFLETEQCGEMIDSNGGWGDGLWNNLACTEPRTFGCEFFPTHMQGCDEGWERFNGYCYYSSYQFDQSEFVTNDEASARCQARGGNLVSIHTAEENDFIYGQFIAYGAWIGLTDSGHTGSFSWPDGTIVSYTNLATNDGVTSPTCAVFSYGSTSWSLTACDGIADYICKKPQVTVPINPPDTGCKVDEIPYKTSCYRMVLEAKTWSDARSDCEAMDSQDSHLVVLNDRFETAFISSVLGEVGDRAWIGLSGTLNSDNSVTFSWVNGDPVDYTNWDEYEPAPDHGTCVAASGEKTNPGLWTVRNCDDDFQYVCESTRTGYTTPVPPLTTKPPGSDCLPGWEGDNGRCYKVINEQYRWSKGEQYCASFGGHLASIETQEEENTIMHLPGMGDLGEFDKLWVGLSMGSDSGYEWTDGTAFSFVNWDIGQPDTNDGRETCIDADFSTLKLANSHCDSHMPFICEAKKGEMVTTLAPLTTPNTQKCSDDESWFLYNEYCYRIVSESDGTPQSWWSSHHLCREEGGELASVHTVEENYWIESVVSVYTDTTLWLGGRSKLGSGYEWIDETPFDFTSWADGEPNNVQNQEDCISMYSHQQGYWNDANCGQAKGRICKRPHGHTHKPAQTTTPAPGHCPEGWLHTGNKCVQFNVQDVNFDTARQNCRDQGTGVDLVSIHSAAEEAYLLSALSLHQDKAWLGMRNEDGFHWVDQTAVTYTNWAPGEPSGGNENCVHAFGSTGMWNDIDCTARYPYICMMVQDPNEDTHNPAPKCPEPFQDYVLYNGACYKAVPTAMAWQTAEQTCVDDGAHLASVLNMAEDSFIWVVAQENQLPDMWIGLNDIQYANQFKWSDGWSAGYTNWGNDHPTINNATGPSCVKVDLGDGLWYSKTCDNLSPFLCKYTNRTIATPDPPISGHCPDTRWMDLGGAYCYLVSTESLNWNDANAKCLQENSNLTSIHSEAEQQLITFATSSVVNPIWIGLVEKENGYGWSDNTGLDYVNWENGEPNSQSEQCAEMRHLTGNWNDEYCTNKRQFMCKVMKEPNEKTDAPPPTVGTTHRPGGGGGGSTLSGGAIAGIVIAVVLIVAAVGAVAYTYVRKQPKKVASNPNGYDNMLFSGDNPPIVTKNSEVVMLGVDGGGSNA